MARNKSVRIGKEGDLENNSDFVRERNRLRLMVCDKKVFEQKVRKRIH